MTTFRIDVVVDPRKGVAGTKAVERGLTDLEKRANRTLLQLRKVFAGITVGLAVREITRLADAYTNLQNRLRVVTDGQRELEQTTEALLQVANRSRSSFESTAELYSRLALATRELGIGQSELLSVTESINKAIILSGASAKEANNGLIQLSQGLASGRLTGDELRSTLEQLPVVADVIAKELGVTRGELRKLGAEGKITSDLIISAFQNAEEEIEQNFAKTVPTLSQSFVVLRNNVVAFIGRINEGTGALRAFGAAIRFIGENLPAVIKSFGVLAATLGALKIAPRIQEFVDLNKAIREGRAVRLGSIAAINAQNASIAAQAATNAAAAAAEVKRIEGIIASTRAEAAATAATLSRNQAILVQIATEQRLIPVKAQLTAATNALAAAEARAAATAATASKQVTFFSQTLTRARTAVNALTAAIAANPVGAIVVGLTAAISALVFFRNEIKLTEDGVATLNDLFAEFFDQLGTALGFIGDLFREAFDGALQPVIDFVAQFDLQFRDVLLIPAAILDSLIGLFVGTFNAIIEVFANLPAALGSLFIQAVNGIITAIEFLPDVFVGIIQTIGQTLDIFIQGQIGAFRSLGVAAQQALAGNFEAAAESAREAAFQSTNAFERASEGIGDRFARNIAANLDDEFIPRIENTFDGAAGTLAERVASAFTTGLESSPVTDFALGLLEGAEERGQDREAAQAAQEKAEADKAAAQAALERANAVAQLIAPLEQEGMLLRIAADEGQREADIQRQLLDIKRKAAQAGVELTAAEQQAVEAQVRQNEALKEQLALQQRLIPIEEQLAERTRIAQEAFDNKVISAAQLAEELRNIELAAAEAGKTVGDGLTRFFAKAAEEAQDLASVTEDILAASFSAAEDALVEFATTGQFSFRDFANGLIKDITRIIVKLLILKAIEAIGGGAGSAAGSATEGVTGALQDGGLATANKPFLVGEEGPEIFTPGQTGTVTPTDQTIEALAGGAGGGGETMVIQAPAPDVNVQTVVVDDPNKIPSAIESPDGQQSVLNVINQNRSNIKRTLG